MVVVTHTHTHTKLPFVNNNNNQIHTLSIIIIIRFVDATHKHLLDLIILFVTIFFLIHRSLPLLLLSYIWWFSYMDEFVLDTHTHTQLRKKNCILLISTNVHWILRFTKKKYYEMCIYTKMFADSWLEIFCFVLFFSYIYIKKTKYEFKQQKSNVLPVLFCFVSFSFFFHIIEKQQPYNLYTFDIDIDQKKKKFICHILHSQFFFHSIQFQFHSFILCVLLCLPHTLGTYFVVVVVVVAWNVNIDHLYFDHQIDGHNDTFIYVFGLKMKLSLVQFFFVVVLEQKKFTYEIWCYFVVFLKFS